MGEGLALALLSGHDWPSTDANPERAPPAF